MASKTIKDFQKELKNKQKEKKEIKRALKSQTKIR